MTAIFGHDLPCFDYARVEVARSSVSYYINKVRLRKEEEKKKSRSNNNNNNSNNDKCSIRVKPKLRFEADDWKTLRNTPTEIDYLGDCSAEKRRLARANLQEQIWPSKRCHAIV
jgi:hypothetical protein